MAGIQVLSDPNAGPAIPSRPPSSSPLTMPSPPPGIVPSQAASAYASKWAEEQQNEGVKALGSAEFLSLAPKSIETYKQYPEVFGPIHGSEEYNKYVRNAATLVPGQIGQNASRNMTGHDQVRAATTLLSQSGLKAAYGARISNMELNQNDKLYGGILSASADSATQSVEREMAKHAATLQNAVVNKVVSPEQLMADPKRREGIYQGIQHGLLDPQYFLPRVSSPSEAHALGSGAMFLTPDGRIKRVP